MYLIFFDNFSLGFFLYVLTVPLQKNDVYAYKAKII